MGEKEEEEEKRYNGDRNKREVWKLQDEASRRKGGCRWLTLALIPYIKLGERATNYVTPFTVNAN